MSQRRKGYTLILLTLMLGCVSGMPMCGGQGSVAGCGCLSSVKQMAKLDKAPPVEISVLLPRFDCAQAPTSEHCFVATKEVVENVTTNVITVGDCIPDNPATLWNENSCCETFKKIKEARLSQGLTPEQSVAIPFSEAEAKEYQAACCEFPDPGLHDCCMAVMTKGGDLSVCATINAPKIPALSLDCHADNPDDRASGPCAADGISCTYSFTKSGGPAPFTCEPKEGIQPASLKLQGGVSADAMDIIQSVQWIQVRGSKKIKLKGKEGGGEPLTSSSVIFETSKSLATEPIDLTLQGFAPPASSAVGKEGWETFQFMAIMKDINGNPINTAIGLINVTNGDAFGAGGCGCRKN